jgi:hypothetical protein
MEGGLVEIGPAWVRSCGLMTVDLDLYGMARAISDYALKVHSE